MNKYIIRFVDSPAGPRYDQYLVDIDWDGFKAVPVGCNDPDRAFRISFRPAHYICQQLRRAGYHSARVVAVHV